MNTHFDKSHRLETDFRRELVNLEKTRFNFRDCDDLYLPKSYPLFSSSRTMVMEWVRGTRIDKVDQIKEQFGKNGPVKAADILVEAFSKMIFKHGFVHCDAHPGNIFVRENP